MSRAGLADMATALSVMQETRIRLLAGDLYDIRMARLLDKAHEAIKDEFTNMGLEPEFPSKAVRDSRQSEMRGPFDD